MGFVSRDEIVSYLNERLQIDIIDDRSVNGLQVQGTGEVNRVALATDAAVAVYKQAKKADCQMIFCHHGLSWGGIRAVRGQNYEHLKFLFDNDMNLYAAHLPLDVHPELGNNVELARIAGLEDAKPFGRYRGVDLGFAGTLPEPMTLDDLASIWQQQLGGEPMLMAFGPKSVRTVGIVSGGGSGVLGEAISKGLDCFVTGEGTHPDYHAALEGQINVIYLSHYYSEIPGVKAVGRELEERFGLETTFIDVPTLF
jgi:dinuclear metal center YbgI/SA1388 family protein